MFFFDKETQKENTNSWFNCISYHNTQKRVVCVSHIARYVYKRLSHERQILFNIGDAPLLNNLMASETSYN